MIINITKIAKSKLIYNFLKVVKQKFQKKKNFKKQTQEVL